MDALNIVTLPGVSTPELYVEANRIACEGVMDEPVNYQMAQKSFQMLKKLEEAQAESKLWESRAKDALRSSKEELARQAVDNKLQADGNVKQYHKLYTDISSQRKVLREQVDILKDKLVEARNRQAMLMARDKVADARKEVASAVGDLDSSGAFAKMDKMERKIAEKEAQADATFEISGIDADKGDPFVELEKKKAAEDELARLKKELSGE